MSRRSIVPGIFALLLSAGTARAGDIRDVRPPLSYPPDYWFFLGLPLLGLALFVFWLIRRGLRPGRVKRVQPVPPPPPWEVAYQRLTVLRASGLSARGQVKDYYSELSAVTRHYIEGRFQIKAPEMTTEEFLQSLKYTSVLNAQQKASLQDFLNCCDMVKFAKFASSEAQMEASFDMVWRFVEETRPAAA